MSRLSSLLLIPMTLVLPTSCSDLGTDGGSAGGAGSGGSGGAGLVDPGPQTRGIQLGCTQNVTQLVQSPVWQLTVETGPILAGEPIGADFKGIARFGEAFLHNAVLGVEGGFERVEVLDVRATVRIRRGATGPPVVLRRPGGAKTCTYDDAGRTGVGAGGFPECDEADDQEDGSNDGCTGLGGGPSPDNPCRDYETLPTSHDCDPGGRCQELDGGTGLKMSECEANGFCIVGQVEIDLEGDTAYPVGLRAGPSGSVFFGWDDQDTGATIVEEGQNAGTWDLPLPVFDEPGPNSLRTKVGGISVAYECTMAVQGNGPDGVDSRDKLPSPTPDYKLIHFPIRRR